MCSTLHELFVSFTVLQYVWYYLHFTDKYIEGQNLLTEIHTACNCMKCIQHFSHPRAKVWAQNFLVPKSKIFFFHQGVVDFFKFREVSRRKHTHTFGLPGGTSDKEPACQCRRHKRHRFDPSIGKILWRRAWQLTSVFLPGKSCGQRSLAGYTVHRVSQS